MSKGWHVIAEANRIFGYDAWDRRTLSKPLRVERRLDGAYRAGHLQKPWSNRRRADSLR